ncbi:hypothetical protein ACCO45_000073 [Purpureocillium lilacinum]|uniref:Uncharacterized protein n=1 Tax=Purpureocillium lilacinum TaxID=33203 RepID=A0ACC4E4K5_PURLI
MTNLSHFVDVNVAALATDAGYFAKLPATNIIEPAISLLAYHDDFYRVLGRDAKARKVWDLPWEAFHEAGIYNKRDNSLYVTSNFQSLKDNINITVVSLDSDDYPFYSTHFTVTRGDFERPSQLLAVDPNTNKSTPVLTNFLGRNFSSLNDVRQHPVTGDLWFTDADYGYFQHFRAEPTQPKQVYRFEPDTGAIQVVADGFVQPNGLEFSPDLKTLYVSDTGSQQFKTVPTGPSSIYAFDVIDKKRLANRRTFAWADTGFPDGVHCDTKGNVWASCGDGVHIWNKKGEFLGKIFVGEMSNNFAFAPGKVFVFSNARLWVVENVKAQGREVCQDFGVGCDK